MKMKKKEKTVEDKQSEEVMKAKADKKYLSRKFIVWVVASVFVLFGFILSLVNKAESAILSELVEWWGWVSVIYIGGNVAQKKIPSFDKAEGEK